MNFDPPEQRHESSNIYAGKWVRVSPYLTNHTLTRQSATVTPVSRFPFAPTCYSYSVNKRACGALDKSHTLSATFVPVFSALNMDIAEFNCNSGGLLKASVKVKNKVILFRPSIRSH